MQRSLYFSSTVLGQNPNACHPFLSCDYHETANVSPMHIFGGGSDSWVGNPGNAADDTSSPNPGGSVGYNYEFARTKSAAALPQPKKFSIQLGRANEIISADGIIEQLQVTSGFVKSVSNTS